MALTQLDPGAAPNNGLGTTLRAAAAIINAIITNMWDTVTGGISYAGGMVGIGKVPIKILDVEGNVADFITNLHNTNAGGSGLAVSAGSTTTSVLLIRDSSLATKLKVLANGEVTTPDVYNNTTASAANMYIDAAGLLHRSTSSERKKKDITNILPEYSAKIFDIAKNAAIFYKSTSKHDNPKWTFYGLSAEKLALIDKRLVHWGYWPEDYNIISKKDKKGNKFTEKVLKKGAKITPVGVQESKILPLIIKEMDRMNDKINNLEQRLLNLENK